MPGKKQKEFQKLVQKYLDGTAKPEEDDALDRYYLLFCDEPANTSLLNDEQLSLLEQRMERGLFGRIQQPAKVKRLWPRIAIAAAVATMVLGAGMFVYKKQQKTSKAIIAYANEITPGKVGATLTLASGKKIRLGDAANGEIAKEAGISVTKTADGQIAYEIKESSSNGNKINTLTTAKGETYILILPDKSKVWMNAASSLTYSASLRELGVRRVKLEGEAYFQIAKDKAHPFIVESKNQEIEVLGTHFNVNSYPEEKYVKTTLAEGSVKIVEKINRGTAVLNPGQQAIANTYGIQIKQADLEAELGWKDGMFISQGQDFKTMMRAIGRWYDVDIVFDYEPINLHIAMHISRTRDIAEVLKRLEGTRKVKFKIEGRRVRVIK